MTKLQRSMIEHILPSRGGNSYVFHHYTVEKETLARFRPLSAAEKPGWEGETIRPRSGGRSGAGVDWSINNGREGPIRPASAPLATVTAELVRLPLITSAPAETVVAPA